MNTARQLARGSFAAPSLLLSAIAYAGGSLETVDITAGNSTLPGSLDGVLIPITWDTRCIPVNFTLDNTPPNALSVPEQTVDINTTRAELQTAMDQWNRPRTSFIQLDITAVRDLHGGALTPQGTVGAFDFINELNFVTQAGFLAAAASVSLIKDTTLTAGQDIDLDGDSDVFTPSDATGRTCRDVDADGDIEFSAGFYKAGTILESDVGFSATNDVLWNTTPDNAITADIQGVALHEFGHSHGLSHSLINQISADDGNGATMFPFIDINDPDSEEAERSLAMDDMAWSSFLYPEGSASSGPGALQPGDRPFKSEFGLVRGEVVSGTRGGPVVGADVWLEDAHTGEVVVSGFSGSARVLVVPGPAGSTGFGAALEIGPSRDFSIINGNYVIPAPAGVYNVGVQPVDGLPVAPGSIGFTAFVGSIFTDLDFQEEYWNAPFESATEKRAGDARPLHVAGGQTRHVDFKTNIIHELTVTHGFFSFELQDFFCCEDSEPGALFAVRFTNAKARAFIAGGSVVHSAVFLTALRDASVPAFFKSASLATGRVTGERTVSIDLNSPLQKQSPFLAQEADFSPWYFKHPTSLTRSLKDQLERSPDTDLFLVLELPDAPIPGVSGLPPFLGMEFFGGNSYRSTDGGVTFEMDSFSFDYFFDLLATP